MIPKALRKSAEFLARQLALALDDMTGRLAERIKRAADPMKKARAMLAEALRLIDRNSKDGAATSARLLREVGMPFFGKDAMHRIGAAL